MSPPHHHPRPRQRQRQGGGHVGARGAAAGAMAPIVLGLVVLMLATTSPLATSSRTRAAFLSPPPLSNHRAPLLPRGRRRHLARAASQQHEGQKEAEVQETFARWFQGEFDNAAQVAEERAQGMGPGPEGGHEQIHCRLEPLLWLTPGLLDGGRRFLGATYYFDNQPQAVFRCRVYSFHPPPSPEELASEAGDDAPPSAPPPFTEMRLHRFTPEFEAGMRACGYDLAKVTPAAIAGGSCLELLDGCSVLWAVAGEAKSSSSLAFRGTMRHGFCVVASQREAGVDLRIEDDLLLTEAELSVNDRGFDCQTGRLVYGNHRNLPYRMERRRW